MAGEEGQGLFGVFGGAAGGVAGLGAVGGGDEGVEEVDADRLGGGEVGGALSRCRVRRCLGECRGVVGPGCYCVFRPWWAGW